MKKRRQAFDNPWKEILHTYFEQFLRFFFPTAAEEIDWSKGYVSLDKELRQITRDAELGVHLADYLVKVWKHDGEENWVLAHIEVQAQPKEDFAHRVYVYHYRIHDRYNRPTASFAILADDEAAWRPTEYTEALWGCRTDFQFPTVKILDYQRQKKSLKESNNPFAMVVLTHLKTLETKNNDTRRFYWKIHLTKELYKHGFSKIEVINLYRFIDWVMVLPKELEDRCYQRILKFKEEHRMPYISTAERIGIEKGMQAGIQTGIQQGVEKGRKEGRKEGLLIGEILLAQRVLNVMTYSQEELERKNLEELQTIFEKFDAKLTQISVLARS